MSGASITQGYNTSTKRYEDIKSNKGNLYVTSNAGKSIATLTRPNNATPYTVGNVCGTNPATNLVFENVLPTPGLHFMITALSLRVEVNSVPVGMNGFRLHLFDSAPTPIVDGAAFNVISADKDKYLGFISIDNPEDIGDEIYIRMQDFNFQDQLASGSTTLYGVLETRGAYTPSAQAVKVLKPRVVGV